MEPYEDLACEVTRLSHYGQKNSVSFDQKTEFVQRLCDSKLSGPSTKSSKFALDTSQAMKESCYGVCSKIELLRAFFYSTNSPPESLSHL